MGMIGTVSRGFDRGEKVRLGGFSLAVLALHIAGWGVLIAFGMHNPAFFGLGWLAYTFGLRHAFDADHISAIDNTTRKLLADGGKPVGAGFFFSLGHSTVVFLIALGLGFVAKSLVESGQLKSAGFIVGTGVSGVFLVAIGAMNLAVLLDIASTYRKMRRGVYDKASLKHELAAGGLMTRLFGRLFKVIRSSWQLYPIGFLFGLGFDTASEVALLAISAGAAAQGVPFLAVLSLPVIFAAGMSLMDTADGAFMAKAYGWAFSNPVRKVFYNMTVTGLSVFVALFVGGIELSQITIGALRLHGGLFDLIGNLDFGSLGFVIVAAFVLTWVLAFTVFKVRRVEERWGAMIEGGE
jgi:high-affinity nickel-transport protein